MNILFLSAANSIHTIRWVNALAERGLNVVLVSLKNHKDKEDLISRKVKVIYLPAQGLKGYYLNAYALRRIYNRKHFDVVNAHYASGYGTLVRIAGLPNILLSVWGSDIYDFPYKHIWNRVIIRKNLEYASMIASTSYNMAKQTETLLKIKKNIEITPFGVDGKKFYSASAIDKKEEETVFGIVKTLSPKYGIDTVMKAFTIFWGQLPVEEKKKVKLEIYGKGELLEELKELAKQWKIEKNICFMGYILNDQVPDALNHMDIFVLGSKSESFGVAAVEAMACGLPVIATNVAGFREVIEDKVTGYLVPVKDAELMAKCMMKLYCHKELRRRMGIEGRKRYEAMYEWNHCVDKMVEIYKQMIKKEAYCIKGKSK